MASPVGRPDFTEAQRWRLKELGVLVEQIDELRDTLPETTYVPARRATLDDVRDVLTGVATRAGELGEALEAIMARSDAAKSEAMDLLGKENADGLRRLARELLTLAQAAQRGIYKRGTSPTRHHSPRADAIGAIDEALTRGWTRASGAPRVRRLKREDGSVNTDEVDRLKVAKKVPHMRQYQSSLWPSESEKSPFLELVEICFDAGGASDKSSPKSAIRKYLKSSREQFTKLTAALWPAQESTLKRTPRKR